MDIHLLVENSISNRSFVNCLGRIMLDRMIKTDLYIDIDLEQKLVVNIGEYGDSSGMAKTILNQQSNA